MSIRRGEQGDIALITWCEERGGYGGMGSTDIERHYKPPLSRPFLMQFLFMKWRVVEDAHFDCWTM